MKATITKSEATDLLKRMWSLLKEHTSSDLGIINIEELTIEGDVNPYGETIASGLCKILFVQIPNYDHSDKIKAIKAIRELTKVGLAEAKYVTEHPLEAIEYATIRGHINGLR